jgi:hypothetical protein
MDDFFFMVRQSTLNQRPIGATTTPASPLPASSTKKGLRVACAGQTIGNIIAGFWHPHFLGWPSVSPEPVRKEHISDWITAHNSSGESLKSANLERLPAQVTDNIALITYRA